MKNTETQTAPAKQKIKQEIYSLFGEGNFHEFRFSDLPKDIQGNDIIDIHRENAFYSENNSYHAYSELVIFREREETDYEYQKRISENQILKDELKNRRYEQYLKLKSEFEPQQ